MDEESSNSPLCEKIIDLVVFSLLINLIIIDGNRTGKLSFVLAMIGILKWDI